MPYTFGPFTQLKTIHFPGALVPFAWTYGVTVEYGPDTPAGFQVATDSAYKVEGVPPFLSAAEIALLPKWDKDVSKGPAGKTFVFSAASVTIDMFTDVRGEAAPARIRVFVQFVLTATPPKPNPFWTPATNRGVAGLRPIRVASGFTGLVVDGPGRVTGGRVVDPMSAGSVTLTTPFRITAVQSIKG